MADLLVPDFDPGGIGAASKASEAVAEITSYNANQIAFEILEAITNTNNLATTAKDFAEGLKDGTDGSLFSNGALENSLAGVGLFDPLYFNSIGTSFAGVADPTTALVDAIAIPPFDNAPQYTETVVPFRFDESLWDTSLLDAAKIKLLSDLANGGYGIEPTDEAALWARERERESVASEALVRQATTQNAARGFPTPPGAMMAQIAEARQQGLERVSTASRDIAMKRADLYVQNRQFTFQMARDIEQALLAYIDGFFGRKLEAAKGYLDAYAQSVAIYQARVQAFLATTTAKDTALRAQVAAVDAKVRVYTAQLSKYEIQLRDQIQKVSLGVEAFKANIAANSAYNDAKLKSDGVRIEAARARLTQGQLAIQNAAELNKLKLGAMENAAKLYIEPASALATIANAYIGASSSLAVDI